MRILSLTTLYPSINRPAHGVFVENRLRALSALGHEIKIIAPVPWFPSTAGIFGSYAKFAAVPRKETRHGLDIEHPRYGVLPKIGMSTALLTLTQCFKDALARAQSSGFFPDVIDAHYYYPDGVAAVAAAQHFDLPVVVTARGTDINLIAKDYPRQRQQIINAARSSQGSICVAEALRAEMIDLGVAPDTVHTIRNGVDLETFCDAPAHPALAGLDLSSTIIASVGHLIERKGHHLVIEAIANIPDTSLLIVGKGPQEHSLRALAQNLGVQHRVHFLGLVPHEELKAIYSAAAVTVLASSREGWPNVLLESMACGTPCVATPVWGSGEVIAVPEAGLLAKDRSVGAIRTAITALLQDPPERANTRHYAEQFSWPPVANMVSKIWHNAAQAGWGTPKSDPFKNNQPKAILTVDTEEIFDWNGEYKNWSLPPIEALHKLQDMAEAENIQPLYFTTYPLLEDDAISGLLASWVREGRAAAGLHVHNWATPPEGEPSGAKGSFQCNIDHDLHKAKLKNLCDLFATRIGAPAIAHRAGRYGIAPWVLDQLAEFGVMFDFSPSTGFDFSPGAGPDFTQFGLQARKRETAFGPQWVFPVSGARKWRGTKWFLDRDSALGRMPLSELRKQMTVPVRLTPEGHDLAHLQLLTQHLRKTAPNVILTPSLHLTSLIPKATSYSSDEAGVQSILQTMGGWLRWAADEGIQAVTLDDISQATAHTQKTCLCAQ